MPPALLSLLMLLQADSTPVRRNHAPIALIGGFTSWGREELLGFRYWGGKGRDIQEDLKTHGFETLTVPVGPLSSNWDRACEAYAILKGGRTDYGKAHAERHGHARFGRAYPGLLEGWGKEHAEGLQKLHLVGHSQGGQTARVLTHLLAQGDEAERISTDPAELSPLFLGGHDWVFSVSTLSAPHEGTSLVYRREGLMDPVRRLFALFLNMSSRKDQPLYDLKLDQWGLQRAEEESLRAFSKRIFASPLWKGTKDFSAWDLGPQGARELHAWAKASPRVYYFSWATAKSRADETGNQVPAPRMTLLWREGSRYLGQTLRPQGTPPIDATWWRNDGVVNTRSMAGPTGDAIAPFESTPQKGLWNFMGTLEGWDHSEIIGIGPEHGDEVLPFYRHWAAFLGGLEE